MVAQGLPRTSSGDAPPDMPASSDNDNARAWLRLLRAGVAVSALRKTIAPPDQQAPDRPSASAVAALDLPHAQWRAVGAGDEALAILRGADLVPASDLAWLDAADHHLIGW